MGCSAIVKTLLSRGLLFLLLVSWPAGAAEDAPREYVRLAKEHARRHGLDHSMVIAIMRRESGFDPRAVSAKGALGLMQLMPDTARRFGVRDPFDPAQNVRGACAYLAWLLDRFGGDLVLALAAYNAGEETVETYGGVPPFAETRAYVAALTRQGEGGRRGQARSGSGLSVEWRERGNSRAPAIRMPSWGGPPDWR